MVNFFSGSSCSPRQSSWTNNGGKCVTAEDLSRQSPVRASPRQFELEHPLEPGNIHDVVDHIDHIVRVAGIDHVGLGSDFDGVSKLPRQLEDVATYPRITQVLLDRGYTEDEIHQILSGNIRRVMAETEKIAVQLQKE